MNTTRHSLLLRVRDVGDRDAWDEFYELYAPLLERFARRQGLRPDDAEEIRDQCLELLARKMPAFRYDAARGSFKSWLFRVAHGRVVDLRRKRPLRHASDDELALVEDPGADPCRAWERVWRTEHLRYALGRACEMVSARNARAFEMLLHEEWSVPDVCAALGMNANQVYKAKGQVLRHVRRLMRELGA